MLTCPVGTVVNDGEPLSEGFTKWRTPTLFEPNVRDTITITITNLFFFRPRERGYTCTPRPFFHCR